MKRLLVTGSRFYTDRNKLMGALMDARSDLRGVGGPTDGITLVHGAAPGLDSLAAWVWHSWGLTTEAHPADWDRACDALCTHQPRFRDGVPYCPAAGYIRNQEMVDLGADLCLAFPLGESRGTRDCMRRTEKAGIEVRVIE